MVDPITRAAAGGGGAAAAVVDDDMSGDGMQCSDHPYRSSSPGGICAFCLQEKLGKLVSTSSSFFIGSSSSSSPSFRSDVVPASTAALRLNSVASAAGDGGGMSSSSASNNENGNHNSSGGRFQYGDNTSNSSSNTTAARRAPRMPFLKNRKTAASSSSSSIEMVLKRSKSIATARSTRFFPSSSEDHDAFTPRPRGFWSFLHPKKPDHRPTREAQIGPGPGPTSAPATGPVAAEVEEVKRVEYVVVEEAESSPNSSGGGSNTASFGRKVSRSRSVGCGSRSFSGDFFERISTGFGDCTLRRVESQREGKRSSSASRAAGDAIKERVRCGGLFGGFMITSSSSSSSSSSYWASVGDDHHANGRPSGPTTTPGAGPLVHGRSRNWGWAFASPMRAFGKPGTTTITTSTTMDGKRDLGTKNSNGATTTAPNLAAIPSLLAVRVNRGV